MNGPNVHIAWSVPDNGGSTILSYTVLILKNDGTLSQELNYCDGSNFVVMGSTFCEVPMPVLTSAPFSLPQGAMIRVSVYATNAIGSGIGSTLNSFGVLAQLKPWKPVSAPLRNSGTSETALVIDYPMLTGSYTG